MGRTVHLDRNKRSSAILRSLDEMRSQKDLCDFTIIVQGKKYDVHKYILAAGSRYFQAMLKYDTKESQEGRVEMKCVDAECVQSCIDFIYSGTFVIPDGKIADFVNVANMMQLDDVTKVICNIRHDELTPENFYETRDLAEICCLGDLSSSCIKYYEKFFLAVSDQPSFEDEDMSQIAEILASPGLKLSEKGKLEASLRWVGGDPERQSNLFRLISLIDLSKVSPVLMDNPTIKNDAKSLQLIKEHLKNKYAVSGHQNTGDEKRIVLFDYSSKSFRTYEPATKNITQYMLEDYGPHTTYCTILAMDSFIYVLCENRRVYRLNVREQHLKWEEMAKMLEKHGNCPPTVALFGELFVIGHFSRKSGHCIEKFNPELNIWTKCDNKPREMCFPTLVSLDDSIYCIGGLRYVGAMWECGDYSLQNAMSRFTPSLLELVDLEPMRDKYSVSAAVALETHIIVTRQKCTLTEVNCYDVMSEQWSLLAPLNWKDQYNIAAYFIDDCIYVVGNVGDETLAMAKYVIGSNEWHEVEMTDSSGF